MTGWSLQIGGWVGIYIVAAPGVESSTQQSDMLLIQYDIGSARQCTLRSDNLRYRLHITNRGSVTRLLEVENKVTLSAGQYIH